MWLYNCTSHSIYTSYNFHNIYIYAFDVTDTQAFGEFGKVCTFGKNWFTYSTVNENYTWPYWWSTNSGWTYYTFLREGASTSPGQVLTTTVAASSKTFNDGIFSSVTSTVGASAIQINYDGLVVSDGTGHIHAGTKVLSMVGQTVEPIQTVDIEIENTGSEGDLTVFGLVLPDGITSDQSTGFSVGEGSTYTVTLSVANTNTVGYYSGEMKILHDATGGEFTIATVSGSVTAQPADVFIIGEGE
ncbi:unnamed protein product [marine sediment metagenome]|uniref:Uncharacterized protein n=1 Tax=marine sediment metagenome TaxID=412755 RepID=X1DIE8_9ZZZZ